MGGCRCSYRDCKARSDGQIHMFHFPVFNKVRCHLWIKNAHKPDFLNLKVSQLKNRVVCQHHFRNDCFMNIRKDKLKHDAVPTEDGPLCTPDSSQPDVLIENDIPGIAINVDDIEIEKLDSVEKKFHGSVKYGDFLISDTTELYNASIDSQASLKKKHSSKNLKNIDLVHVSNNEDNYKYTINYVNEENTEPKLKILNEDILIPRIVSLQYADSTKMSNDNLLHNTLTKDELNYNLPAAKCSTMTPNIQIRTHKTRMKHNPMPRTVSIALDESTKMSNNHSLHKNILNTDSAAAKPSKMNPKVQIISQKTISEPVLVEGRLETVSPSMIIEKPRRQKRNLSLEQEDVKPIAVQQDNENVRAMVQQTHPEVVYDHILPIEYVPITESDAENQKSLATSIQHPNIYEPLQMININSVEKNNNSQNDPLDISQLPIELFVENITGPVPGSADKSYNLSEKPILTPTSTPVYKSLLKSKITPEKLAAIEEKRKFNLKMRDVITSCLDNLEDSNEDILKKIAKQKMQSLPIKLNEKRSLLKEQNPPVVNQDSIIAFLDKRLQNMESTLLNKIVHNTQRINDLRRVIKPSSHSKNANTQTYLNEMCDESQKHFLYKEISKFLSPDANIKIFQELFLDKTEDDEAHIPTPRKLRRRR